MSPGEKFLYEELTYKLIGLCMEVHRTLGLGHLEAVYKDALEYEFRRNNVQFSREQKFRITYKDFVLPHRYNADFVIEDLVILEVKAVSTLSDVHVKQTLNYLAASKIRIGLQVNFGEKSLTHRRIIL